MSFDFLQTRISVDVTCKCLIKGREHMDGLSNQSVPELYENISRRIFPLFYSWVQNKVSYVCMTPGLPSWYTPPYCLLQIVFYFENRLTYWIQIWNKRLLNHAQATKKNHMLLANFNIVITLAVSLINENNAYFNEYGHYFVIFIGF